MKVLSLKVGRYGIYFRYKHFNSEAIYFVPPQIVGIRKEMHNPRSQLIFFDGQEQESHINALLEKD